MNTESMRIGLEGCNWICSVKEGVYALDVLKRVSKLGSKANIDFAILV